MPPAPRKPSTSSASTGSAGTHERIVSGAGHASKAADVGATGRPSTTRSAVKGAAGGAVTGAGLGSVVPGVGTAAGAAAGAVVGGAGGAIKGHRAKVAARRAAAGPGRRILIAEFGICMIILALSPLTDKHKQDGPGEFARRASAVMVLFLVLALIATGGPRAAKVAAAFGALVTASLLLSSRDVLSVIAARIGSAPAAPAEGDEGLAGGAVGDAAVPTETGVWPGGGL